MFGFGTIFNVAMVLGGGLAGMLFRNGIKDRFKDALMNATSVAVLFIGISGAVSKMLIVNEGVLEGQKTMMMIASMAVGTLLGEILDIEKLFEDFGKWLKKVTKSEKDNQFIEAFLSASLTICIGAMAVVGSIQDGIAGDSTTLIAKGILDAIIIMIMTVSSGKGCIFSAIPVLIFQGSMTVLARFIAPFMTEMALDNISLVGSIMIFCVGYNLLMGKKFKVANMLPALLIAVLWAFV